MILFHVYVAEWPPFRKELIILIVSLSIVSICNFGYFFHFDFDGKLLVLIAPVPGHCLSLYF